MRLRISDKYALLFSAVGLVVLLSVLLATGVLIWSNSVHLRGNLRSVTQLNFEVAERQTIHSLAQYLCRELFTPLYELDIENIDASLKDLYKELPVISARISDASGKVLTDGTSDNPSYGTQLHLDTEKLNSSGTLTERLPSGYRVTFRIGTLDVTAGYGEIVFSDEPLRKVLAEQDRAVLRVFSENRRRFVSIAILCIVLVALLTLGMSFAFSRTLAAPLVALRDAARRIARGEFDYRVAVATRDEIGDLATAFNSMVEDLQKRDEAIERSTHALEREIEERKQKERALRESEERLVQAKEAAEGANRAKSEFLANMSHEMRTPLAGALGMIELVLEMEPGDEEREMLEMAKRSCASLIRLISDLLDFSRLEAGKLVFEEKPFSLAMTVSSAVEVVSIQAKEKGIGLLVNLEQSVPDRVSGDEGRLRQVLVNLLGNAVKFTERGTVALRVERFCLVDAPGRDFLLFSVRDTGIGIPSDQLESIFGKFVQVDASSRRRYGGTGLGLALSKQIVEILGGDIWVESELGRGSTFYFTYPLDK